MVNIIMYGMACKEDGTLNRCQRLMKVWNSVEHLITDILLLHEMLIDRCNIYLRHYHSLKYYDIS